MSDSVGSEPTTQEATNDGEQVTGLKAAWPVVAIWALLSGGLGLAIYLVYVKLRLGYDPTFKSVCSFGGKFDCGEVQTHASSELFGVPIGLLAVPTYLVLAWLALKALRPGKGGDGRTAMSYIAGIGSLTVLHTLYLAYLSSVVIGYYCPFCMGLYAVNIGVAGLAFYSTGLGFGGTLREAFGGLASVRGPVVSAAAVLAVAGVGSLFTYEQIRSGMADAEKERIAAEMAELENLSPEDETAKPAEGAQAAPTAGDGGKPAARTTKPRQKPKAVLTENGWSYYDIPVEDDDPVMGPADAPVTLVAVKDFECSYCRYVSYQTKPLKQRHKDQVRFVFKNYPMNSDCNYRMGTTRMHEYACGAAFAGVCAQEQGKFWEMHDVLYKNQKKLTDADLRQYATNVGLDMAAYDACMSSDRPRKKVEKDVRLASKMRINGTPRLYINGRAVTGSVATDVLEYYIELAKKDDQMVASDAKTVDAATPTMVKMNKASGPFWIDAFESSIDQSGASVSVPHVRPAYASWFDAEAACAKAGKRMCTEEEWVSACIGQPAVDHRKTGVYTTGPVVGRLYPYGPFYDKGACRDSEDKYSGEAGSTGANARCRTPEGVYDMSGNLYEWVGDTAEAAAMMGGDYRTGTSGTCRRRATTYGAGIKNNTLGFRCCADNEVKAVADASKLQDTSIDDVVGKTLPKDLVLEARGGGKVSPASFKGKVTFLTFFASWCGNCRKQMPAIKKWQDEWGSKGFQVVGIDVDRSPDKAEKYIASLEPNFKVALDPEARTMGDFDINAMPTSFIVDKAGKIKKRIVGYKDNEIASIRATIESLL